jgi:Ran GTPase-activating protein (RanGAP) involved in mRNA processing and transport
MGCSSSSSNVHPISSDDSTPTPDDFTDLRAETKRVMKVVRPLLSKAIDKLKENPSRGELCLDREVDEVDSSMQRKRSLQQRKKLKKSDINLFTDKHVAALVGSDQLDSPLLHSLATFSGSMSPQRTGSPVWEQVQDASTDQTYYYCEVTGETSSDKPDGFAEATVVKTLSLCDHAITNEGCPSVARMISWSHSCLNIVTLRLRQNNIGDQGAECIAECLFSPGCKLEQLELQGNMIGDQGVKSLATSLKGSCHLRVLSLDRQQESKIGIPGVAALSDALIKSACRLSKLSLSGNKSVNCECAGLLAGALETRGAKGGGGASGGGTSLGELYLSGCGISDDGAMSLSRVLRLLTNLSLSGCRIKDAGGQAIATAEKHCTKLVGLDIQGNQFSSPVAQSLMDNAPSGCMTSVTLSDGTFMST